MESYFVQVGPMIIDLSKVAYSALRLPHPDEVNVMTNLQIHFGTTETSLTFYGDQALLLWAKLTEMSLHVRAEANFEGDRSPVGSHIS